VATQRISHYAGHDFFFALLLSVGASKQLQQQQQENLYVCEGLGNETHKYTTILLYVFLFLVLFAWQSNDRRRHKWNVYLENYVQEFLLFPRLWQNALKTAIAAAAKEVAPQQRRTHEKPHIKQTCKPDDDDGNDCRERLEMLFSHRRVFSVWGNAIARPICVKGAVARWR
jgi:hypothetical protein